ncbi:MAG: ribonuclease Z [Bacteroidota bacterium]
MDFELTILGCNSAIPAHGRHPSAQLLRLRNQHYLIDCGEGTQMRMADHKVRKSRINQIFISHLHGDHVFGLIGLLTSYSLAGRRQPMDLFGPEGLQELIETTAKLSYCIFTYPIQYHLVDTNKQARIFEDKLVEVFSLPLKHRIPTTGFLFREKERPLNLRPGIVDQLEIPFQEIPAIKAGSDWEAPNGQRYSNTDLTLPPTPLRSYAYCSDTMYIEDLRPLIQGVNLLYHEATFLHEKAENAKLTMHSTALQAAQMAHKAQVGQLILGHYSSRYVTPAPLVKEAKTVFQETLPAQEGRVYPIV